MVTWKFQAFSRLPRPGATQYLSLRALPRDRFLSFHLPDRQFPLLVNCYADDIPPNVLRFTDQHCPIVLLLYVNVFIKRDRITSPSFIVFILRESWTQRQQQFSAAPHFNHSPKLPFWLPASCYTSCFSGSRQFWMHSPMTVCCICFGRTAMT